MIRYLAFVWDSSAPEQNAALTLIKTRIKALGRHWIITLDEKGLFVAHFSPIPVGEGVLLLADKMGVALGSLFNFSDKVQFSRQRTSHFDREESDQIIDTDGRTIMRSAWGSYVLMLRDRSGSGGVIFRGPMSRLPCFTTQFRGVTACFSSVEDCFALRLVRFSLNWDSIRAQATRELYLTAETSIKEITHVQCGEALTVRHCRTRSIMHWSPNEIVRLSPSSEIGFEELAAQVRATTASCVAAWCTSHKVVLHSLSGGIDSSIVLACLAQANVNTQVHCLHLHSNDPTDDERRYARSMANKFAVRLLEVQRPQNVDLSIFLNCSMTANPVLNYSAAGNYLAIRKLASTEGATAIFDGELGDNVFGSAPGYEVVLDRIFRNGIDSGILETALDFAHLRRYSIWRVMYETFRLKRVLSNSSF